MSDKQGPRGPANLPGSGSTGACLYCQGLLCSFLLTVATGMLRLPATNFCLVHFLKSLNVSISWSTSRLCIWISVPVICNWMRKMPTALCCLAVPTKGCGALSWLLLPSPVSTHISDQALLAVSLLHPTLPTVGSSTSLFLFLHAVCLTAPWADSSQEVHLGHGEIDLTHSVEDLQGPRVSSGVSLRVLPGRWLSKHCVFQKQMASRCSLCGRAPSWNFWCVLQLGWAADLAFSSTPAGLLQSSTVVHEDDTRTPPSENIPEMFPFQGTKNYFAIWRASWKRIFKQVAIWNIMLCEFNHQPLNQKFDVRNSK